MAWLALTLHAQTNPVPFVNDPLVPDTVTPGSGGFTLTVNGTGFGARSVLNWNGSPRATDFVGGSRLTATILASDVAAAGTASVTVTNPAPGGGTSTPVFFPVYVARPTIVWAPVTAPVTTAFTLMVTGDFNGDGKLDLIGSVPEGGNPNIWIALGNGDGTFQTPVSITACEGTPCNLDSLAVGDFNNDGRLDVAVATGAGVSILLGNGDGTFAPYLFFAVPGQSIRVTAGDFNGDGILDMAVIDGDYDSGFAALEILPGNGDGTFQPAVTYPLGQYDAYDLVVADFNGDGRLDLALTETCNCGGGAGSGVFLMLGNGDGSFQSPVLVAANNGADQLAAADFNGDGIPDLAVGGEVLLGKGDGSFRESGSFGDTEFAPILVGDFNGDGKLDLALTGSSILIFPGNGDGTFEPAIVNDTFDSPSVFAAGDFNGDGLLDLVGLAVPPGETGAHIAAFLQTTVSVTPSALNFPKTLLGKTSAPQTITVANMGIAPLSETQVSISQPVAGEFSIAGNTCTASVAPAGTCAIDIAFTPAEDGLRGGLATISYNAVGGSYTVDLSGLATPLDIAPKKLDFGNVAVGSTSGRQTLRVTNVGPFAADLKGIFVIGRDKHDFSESNDCGSSIAANTSCRVEVRFSPTAAGARKAALTVALGGLNPRRADLMGTGID